MSPLTEAEADRVGAVFAAHQAFVEAVAQRHSPSPQDVPDIVQNVGVNVCRTLAGFRGQAAITTWLYRITVNTARDYVRREEAHLGRPRFALLTRREGETRWGGAELVPQAEEGQDPTMTLAQLRRAEAVREAIAQLRDHHALLVREELDDTRVLSNSKKSSRHRARQRLRELLSADPRLT